MPVVQIGQPAFIYAFRATLPMLVAIVCQSRNLTFDVMNFSKG